MRVVFSLLTPHTSQNGRSAEECASADVSLEAHHSLGWAEAESLDI
jgi:hypothetical protein